MRGINDLQNDDTLIDDYDEYPMERAFSLAREERRTPTNAELLALALEDDDEDEAEVATEMTGNDAFRIIEFIKEREAYLRR